MYLISGTGRDGTGRFREIRVPNFRDDGTVTEILTCLKSGITEDLNCLKSGITENLTFRGTWSSCMGRGRATAEIVEVLILQTHHAMEKPEPYCRRYLAFKPEEAESILRGADDLATSTLNTAHSCMHAQSMF